MFTQEKLQKIKARLLATEKELEEEIKSLENTDFGNDVDSGEEESDETEEIMNNAATKELLETRLHAVMHALSKIEAETYGTCEECGAELSDEMIEVNPESRLCKACKMADESR